MFSEVTHSETMPTIAMTANGNRDEADKISQSSGASNPDRWPAGLEALAAWAFGFALMMFLYSGDGKRGPESIGLPGHDSFYHVKMASMLPEHGLLTEFPWLRFCYFTDQGQDFISHHYGFHLLLAPFVIASQRLTGDPMAGGRWAIAFYFGFVTLLVHLLLVRQGVRCRLLWFLLLLILPVHFYTRHAFVRAIGTSLLFMLLILLGLFRGRRIATALSIVGYIQLYLGGVLFAPLIVAAYVISVAIGPKEDRKILWSVIVASVLGWCVGIVIHPYRHGMLEFLRLQVFGSGLSPDISVGQEWNPYSDTWSFAVMTGGILGVWATVAMLRFRQGPRLSAAETCLTLLHFGFLLLTLKARRFVEYWPIFCLLSASTMASPILVRIAEWWQRQSLRFRFVHGPWPCTALSAALLPICFLTVRFWPSSASARSILKDWPCWSAAITILLLPVFHRLFVTARERSSTADALSPLSGYRFTPVWAVPVFGAILVLMIAAMVLLGFRESLRGPYRLPVPLFAWILIGLLHVAAGWSISRRARSSEIVMASAFHRSFRRSVAAVVVFCAAVLTAGPSLAEARRVSRCQYDLNEIRKLMTFLQETSRPGDVVFTDDWDIFPVMFCLNSRNHYIVGLDPKFTHERKPDLWERFVQISRGQTPTDTTYRKPDGRDGFVTESIHVRLEDIREHFGARFVITDRDHQALADKLIDATGLAEFVYPPKDAKQRRAAPYLLFRIRSAEESAMLVQKPPPADAEGRLFLSRLTPLFVSQEWGDLALNRSVEGGPLRIVDTVFQYGLGTHAASEIRFALPPGYDRFETIVGVDASRSGKGSVVVSVYLDSVRVFRSEVLRGDSPPVTIRTPLGGARELVLKAEPTPDGNRHDHVNWADAKLLRRVSNNGSPETDTPDR